MSSQSDYNNNYQQYILYYCNFIRGDTTIFTIDLAQICTVEYNFPPTIVMITSWLLSSYPQPSNELLLTYSLSTVLTWFDYFYSKPLQISIQQPFKISTTDLANVRVDSSMICYQVLDSTIQKLKMFNGTSWVENTSVMTIPSYVSATTPNSAAVTFVAGINKMVDLTGFTVGLNSNFSVNTATGKITYNGPTKVFNVSCNYSVTTVVPVLTQTLTTYLSKNSSTILSGPRNSHSFIVLVGLSYVYSESLFNNISLNSGDTVQLAAGYTGSGNITFGNISYVISQV